MNVNFRSAASEQIIIISSSSSSNYDVPGTVVTLNFNNLFIFYNSPMGQVTNIMLILQMRKWRPIKIKALA